jgi:hypothetical protein
MKTNMKCRRSESTADENEAGRSKPQTKTENWRTVVSLMWVTSVFVFFFRQYAEKVLDKLGI